MIEGEKKIEQWVQSHIRSTETKLLRMENNQHVMNQTLERMCDIFDDVVATRTRVAQLRDDIDEIKRKQLTKVDVYVASATVIGGALAVASAVITLL